MGRFSYHPLAIQKYQFLVAVERLKLGVLTAFVATPLRALLDLVALRKSGWTDLGWLTSGLRIDEYHLLSLEDREFAMLRGVYKHKTVNDFLRSLELGVSAGRSEEHTSELQSLMRISYDVFCLKKKTNHLH